MPKFIYNLLKRFGIDPKLVELYQSLSGASWFAIAIKLLQMGPVFADWLKQILDLFQSAKTQAIFAGLAPMPTHCQTATIECCDDMIDAAEEMLLRAVAVKAAHMYPDCVPGDSDPVSTIHE